MNQERLKCDRLQVFIQITLLMTQRFTGGKIRQNERQPTTPRVFHRTKA